MSKAKTAPLTSSLQEPLLGDVYLDHSDSDVDTTDVDYSPLETPSGSGGAIILARLKPTGRVAVDGLASKYADTFSPPLARLMSENEFRAAIGAINQTLGDFFPCLCCVAYAYVGYALTCGLLLCCARPCTTEVDHNVTRVLNRINRKNIFHAKGIRWRLHRTRCTSWIEISHSPQHDLRRVSVAIPTEPRRHSIPIPAAPHHSSRPPTPPRDEQSRPS
ncbi:Aste57867_8904 [Aphanomyces stellatus]|uniref:Aste57867_8904 protein n=1 Tax=Aphanomyces stellatus TaxID=120398 RepID=A0A485KLN5_9STRA|nr:hypothetical protein As57867_008869 [Aphanomyces stellatus]VFT85788.1 Aste57867_8904 [Aphanomyces stellatus]